MEFLAVLLGAIVLLRSIAGAAELQWKPLQSWGELQDHDLILCLATFPWNGEAKSFMREFLELLSRERPECAGNLELRIAHTHRDEQRTWMSLTLHKSGETFQYRGKLSAERVLAAVDHALVSELFQPLHTVGDLQEFIGSTDRAFVLVDLCGWTLETGRIVEDYENNEPKFGQPESVLYETANETSSCGSRRDELVFSSFYGNLTEAASASFLTPLSARFGVITLAQVLEDAGLEIPDGKPWFLLRRTEDISRSWRVLDDPALLDDFLENTGVVVDEVDQDTQEIPRDRPSVFLFLSFSPELRGESIEALRIVREVARYYERSHQWKTSRNDSKVVPVVIEQDQPVMFRGVVVKNGQTITLGQKDLGAGIARILQLLLQGTGGKDDPETTAVVDKGTSQDITAESAHETSQGDFAAESQGNGEDEGMQGQENSKVAHGKDQDVTMEISTEGTNEAMQEHEDMKSQEDVDEWRFNFGFFDSAYALQEFLTGTSNSRPSLVAVFPDRNARYVYPDDIPLSFEGLVEFLDGTLSGAVLATLKSTQAPVVSRKAVTPPFVNRDFHRTHPVPSVSLETFPELVMGFRKGRTNSSKSSSTSLVMFTLPWCGFCKRMELAMHEVYKYFLIQGKDDSKSVELIVPSFYQMDCGSNDCSHILANVVENQEFPSLLLFPSEDKDKVSVYKGAPTVSGILHFIAKHGTSTVQPPSTITIQQNLDETSQEGERIGIGHVLLATEKLSANSPNFANSAVVIVSVTDDYVVGLVMNKDMPKEELLAVDQRHNVKIGYGGPLYTRPKYIFTFTRLQNLEGFGTVSYGLSAGGPSATEKVFEIIEANKLPASEFKFVAGHCGWTPLQLREELADGYWQLTQYREDMFQWEGELQQTNT
ncbi:hypothetical protein SELMODRAFT_439850 [Selaginella moellendorffii]|uniref:Thioredoxin domain-containing protein n=1 Tax=Selaginella moellendorffii TaxID=88036 RepID=D8R7S8_SELML|nr:hypothetical protein SELMODRAFT_439850 [Selaginella moellendorffii]